MGSKISIKFSKKKCILRNTHELHFYPRYACLIKATKSYPGRLGLFLIQGKSTSTYLTPLTLNVRKGEKEEKKEKIHLFPSNNRDLFLAKLYRIHFLRLFQPSQNVARANSHSLALCRFPDTRYDERWVGKNGWVWRRMGKQPMLDKNPKGRNSSTKCPTVTFLTRRSSANNTPNPSTMKKRSWLRLKQQVLHVCPLH